MMGQDYYKMVWDGNMMGQDHYTMVEDGNMMEKGDYTMVRDGNVPSYYTCNTHCNTYITHM